MKIAKNCFLVRYLGFLVKYFFVQVVLISWGNLDSVPSFFWD